MDNDPEAPGLYIHIPFCHSRCSYCTFVSSIYDCKKADTYITLLSRELEKSSFRFASSSPSTIFIGGGTPSCLSPEQLEKLLASLPLPALEESTIELNPDSCTAEKLQIIKEAGISRLSFGVQTYSEKGLQILGRRHSANTALAAIDMALELGFPSINTDLIADWPGQKLHELENDLFISSSIGIHHLSLYSIMLEENAPGYGKLRQLMDVESDEDDRSRRYWDFSEQYLEKKGFIHYETSNFSQPGHACRHNIRVWKGGEYLGIGAAAHSHIAGRRFSNIDDIDEYMDCIMTERRSEAFSEILSPMEKARECAVFWWRLFDGIDPVEFRERTGFDLFELYKTELPPLLDQGIMEFDSHHTRLRVAKSYQPLLDAVLADLI